MSFKFLHTADWQLGKRFGSFQDEEATVLRKARFDVIGRLADAATSAGCSAVLVAGDVFDAETVPDMLIRRVLEQLKAHPQLDWHLLPGNHDPARAGGVWSGVAAAGVPQNVHLHLEAKPAELAPGVVLLPAPLASKRTEIDPTAWWDGIAAGAVRIGLAHGSVQGFGSNGDANVPIDPARVKSARLAYMALGDWHGTTRISDRVWYSGTPEPDGFRDNDPGNALIVHVDGEAPPDVTPVRTAHFTWLRRSQKLDDVSSLAQIDAEVSALGRAAAHCLMTLELSGAVPMAELARIDGKLAELTPRLFHLFADMSGVTAFADAADLAALDSPALGEIAQRLKASSENGGADAAVAGRALRRLFALARQAEAESRT
ncbi:DNA repair exonuclease [Hyphomicrobium sp. 1Nfss2.1]|uniref:metallophosphoesterase family protein n=1 Tax=Hyphomicrobium sp. 1Nfss2.1 TaxID=3413936 RepID=UPI003C7B1BED